MVIQSNYTFSNEGLFSMLFLMGLYLKMVLFKLLKNWKETNKTKIQEKENNFL